RCLCCVRGDSLAQVNDLPEPVSILCPGDRVGSRRQQGDQYDEQKNNERTEPDLSGHSNSGFGRSEIETGLKRVNPRKRIVRPPPAESKARPRAGEAIQGSAQTAFSSGRTFKATILNRMCPLQLGPPADVINE